MLKIVVNPNDISPIFKGGFFRNHKSFKVALKSLRSKPDVKELIEQRYLSEKPFDLNELLKLPENSLGKVFAEHMINNKLDIIFYPPLEDKQDDDITYMRKRARQTHDIHHVVLGFPAVDTGEIAISAFYLSQNYIPLSGLLIGVGFFVAILKYPERIEELMFAIITGWTMGKKSKDLFSIKWEDYFSTPIEEVRKMLNIDFSIEEWNKKVKELNEAKLQINSSL
jgi:ubiquinone biosynthesis protein Coq4